VAGVEMRGRLQKLGIFRESGHEHFNGSVVIPIFNLQGVNIAVRKKLLAANPCAGVEFPVAVKGLFRPHYVLP